MIHSVLQIYFSIHLIITSPILPTFELTSCMVPQEQVWYQARDQHQISPLIQHHYMTNKLLLGARTIFKTRFITLAFYNFKRNSNQAFGTQVMNFRSFVDFHPKVLGYQLLVTRYRLNKSNILSFSMYKIHSSTYLKSHSSYILRDTLPSSK